MLIEWYDGLQMIRNTFFTRLILFFLAIALLPIVFLSMYYYTSVTKTLTTNLTNQADASISRTTANFEECLEDYKHRLYLLATDPTTIEALSIPTSKRTTEIYKKIYSIMKGKIYDASAHIVSLDGKIKYSTHEFPKVYDFQYNNNDDSFKSNLPESPSSTMIFMERYINKRNNIILLNLVRTVTDKQDKVLGYVIIDIFASTLSRLYNEKLFSDLVLINMKTLKVASLLHTGVYGDYSQFPALIDTKESAAKNIIAKRSVPGEHLTLAGIVETSSYTLLLKNISLISSIIMLISILAAFLVSFITSKHITRPIDRLVAAMKQVELGELDVRLNEKVKNEDIRILNSVFNDMVIQIRELIALTKEEEKQLRDAERKALQAQINPHFLYNTLYTIKAIAKLHGEKQILTISTELSRLLRNAISSNKEVIPLGESFDLVQSFLTIQKIRFPKKLCYTCTIEDEIRNISTPKLIVQPFVENAISHGLETKITEWRLSVSAWREGDSIVIVIQDNGIGFSPDKLSLPSEDIHDHIGIHNVKKRLELYYNGEASVTITSKIGIGTTVRMTLPRLKEH